MSLQPERSQLSGGWTASQDMQHARINASTGGLHTSTVVAADRNLAITRLTTETDLTVNISLQLDLTNYDGLQSDVRHDSGSM